MPGSLETRLASFAASLRDADAVRSVAVEHAFATVARHRCVPRFLFGPKAITVPLDRDPDDDILDLVYSHRSLLTSTGNDGGPPSSSSAPTLMAKMLDALDLRPGMRVLEIGAGTGYNAALITTITGASVVTVDASASTAKGAAESVRRLGLDDRVHVVHADGYLGERSAAPYDRVIVTCGVAGLSPHWLDQLAPGGVILAPLAHGGVHPVVATTADNGSVHANAVVWADFMPAAGPLRPPHLADHDPTDYIRPSPVTRIPDASPARTTAAYNDLWFFLATRDRRITRAYMDDDTIDPSKGACALHAPERGTAWVQSDGSIIAAGEPAVGDDLRHLIDQWASCGRPAFTEFTTTLRCTDTDSPLWTAERWTQRGT